MPNFAASLRKLGRLATDPQFRTIALMKLMRGDQLHQTTPSTYPNRYPEIFAACAQHLAAVDRPQVLSFGCSTGEEALALHQYFPNGMVTGLEINPRSLAQCRKLGRALRRNLPPGAGLRFDTSTPKTLAKYGPYDAIFCMAVLQRTPRWIDDQGINDINTFYPFARFDDQLSALDAVLKPGGLLIVHHTQYRVRDAAIFARYEPLPVDHADLETPSKFDRHGQRLPPGPREDVIYRKRN